MGLVHGYMHNRGGLPAALAGAQQIQNSKKKGKTKNQNHRFALSHHWQRLRYIKHSLARIPCASTMAPKRRPRSA